MSKFSEYQAVIPSPFATLGLRLENQSISGLDFIFDDISQPIFHSETAESIAEQLGFYLDNSRYRFNLNISPVGTSFQKSVWQQMQAIPSGSCLTYGEVAESLQSGPRAVGNACRKNPIPLIIPCHRIVAKNGLGGFAGATTGQLAEVKRWLLKHESVIL